VSGTLKSAANFRYIFRPSLPFLDPKITNSCPHSTTLAMQKLRPPTWRLYDML